MVRVEHGAAVLGAEVEGILREVVFSGSALRSGAGDVEGGDVVERFGKRVGGQHRKLMGEAPLQTGLQGMIGGVGDAGDFSYRGICAGAGLGDSAAGIKTTLVGVGGGGFARNKHGRIGFNETGELGAFGSDIADFQEPVAAEGALDVEIPILSVRQTQVGIEREQSHRLRESLRKRILSVERISEVGRKLKLRRLQIRRCTIGSLQWAALTRVVRIVEDSIGGGDEPFAAAGGIPGEADAGSKRLVVSLDQPARHSGIAGIKKTGGCGGKHYGLAAWNPKILPVLPFGVRERQLVTQTVI